MNRPASLALVAFLGASAALSAAEAAKPAPAPAAGTPAPGYSLANCVRPFDPAAVAKTSVGYQFWFADSAFAGGNTVKMSVVGPHLATHAPHRHAEEEFFMVIEGTAEFYLDGERKTAGPLTLFYCPSWHEHGIRNVGDTELKYLVLKKYLGPVPAATDVKQVPGAAQPPAAQQN
jgi:quercetin dioxygenase-like cupin family protein